MTVFMQNRAEYKNEVNDVTSLYKPTEYIVT